jgi:hypothetical protein
METTRPPSSLSSLQLCDDHLVKTQSILSSPYVSHIEKVCRVWESKLLDVTSLVEKWMAVQRSWMYLEVGGACRGREAEGVLLARGAL